jgi:ATP-dependent helicase/nuclease subunit B
MVLALPEEAGGVRAADRAWRLARELAALMDEAERAEISLPEALERAADAAHALHWDMTLRFLGIATRAWPAWLGEAGLMNPAARQVALLRAQAAAWEKTPPGDPIWAAGLTAGFPAIAALLRVVARLDSGRVIFPALDKEMPDSAWEALGAGHPQAGLRTLLSGIGARREEVEPFFSPPLAGGAGDVAVPSGRARALAAALLPAEALGAWRERSPVDLGALTRLTPSDAQEEAVAIALVLRDAVETPGRRAALVTPDRALAGRVAAELLRWGIVADDSAGEKLSHTPPAVFLRLLARAMVEQLAPVALLSLLKHPLAAAGMTTVACRAAARLLERDCLRGPKPRPWLPALRLAAKDHSEAFIASVEECLAPLLRMQGAVASPALQMAALVESAEALASTDAIPGPARLWAHEEGEALAELLAGAIAALEHLPDQKPENLPGLLDALLEGEVVRSRRALRGRDNQAEHPRVFIWGLLEARLQSLDRIVLGGLVEGVWPRASDPGPWMSRQMRARAGLDDPEAAIGQAAHDFFSAACAAPEVVLSAPRRRDGAPAVPSRFLTRLEAWLAGQGASLPAHPASRWAALLDQPAGPPRPVLPPAPKPPKDVRPRRLSVTEIETLIADPYAIYARHILRLRPLDPLEQSTDSADYGSLVHKALHQFLTSVGTKWPFDAREKLRGHMDKALSEALARPALTEWWAPRLLRIADWVTEEETRRRAVVAPDLIRTEVNGEARLNIDGPFRLVGRADRVEKRPDGMIAILDYKTGIVPNERAVADGEAPQLTLEAAMARFAAFGPELAGETAELVYWHLTGAFVAGKATSLFKADPTLIASAVDTATVALEALLSRFARAETPYLSQPHPGRRPRFPDYAHLARCAEWDVAEDAP